MPMASDQTCQTDSLHSSLRKQSLLMSLVAECSLLPDGETPSTPSRSQIQGTFWRSLAGEILGWSSWALIFFHWSHHESSKRNLKKKTTPCCRKTQIDGPNSLAERCKNEQNASLAILALTCFDKSRKTAPKPRQETTYFANTVEDAYFANTVEHVTEFCTVLLNMLHTTSVLPATKLRQAGHGQGTETQWYTMENDHFAVFCYGKLPFYRETTYQHHV